MSPASSTESYPAFAHTGLRENPGKNHNQNKVLRKIFGAKRDEVTGEWRKLHNAELHALYTSPDIISNIKSRRLRWAGHVARIGESRNAYRVLVGRPEGKRPLGRPRRRWEDNIKMDLREVGYDGRDWINLAQDRDQWRAYVRAAMNLRHGGSVIYDTVRRKFGGWNGVSTGVNFFKNDDSAEGAQIRWSDNTNTTTTSTITATTTTTTTITTITTTETTYVVHTYGNVAGGRQHLPAENAVHHGALVAASEYALYLFLLHDGAHWTAPLTLCTFQRVLTTTALYAFLDSPIRATCPTHLKHLDVMFLFMLGEEYNACSSAENEKKKNAILMTSITIENEKRKKTIDDIDDIDKENEKRKKTIRDIDESIMIENEKKRKKTIGDIDDIDNDRE
ncbi:hypothetical protein ANN_03524 [Periplaneta americana]|uniref:Uncharacterized protein n=1 Tax=Periplaneta americana TaxID=6978 RepID=A0ABQ8U268_PERAM|nr:hypothetical protein ANN_03524 [Periplaneta americana]